MFIYIYLEFKKSARLNHFLQRPAVPAKDIIYSNIETRITLELVQQDDAADIRQVRFSTVDWLGWHSCSRFNTPYSEMTRPLRSSFSSADMCS